MKRKVVIISSIVFILVLITLFFVYRYKNKSVVYYWRAVQVEKGDVKVLVTATGAIAADTSVDVGVQVSGTIAKINADYNDEVKKGEVIAIVDTTLYYTAKLDALAALSRAQNALDQSEKEFNRSKELFDNLVIAKADYDLSYASLKNAKGNVVSAQAQLSKAAINLTYCRIKAPISGVIISRNVQVGNMVIASFNSPILFNIANTLSKMQVQANVDEADIGLLKVGQRATFSVDAYPNDVFKGIVTQIRRQPVIVQNVVNYVVIIEVENLELKLMPGLTANANIFIEERKNVLKVATNAFNFIPPMEYIQASKLLPDSSKKIWLKKLQLLSEVKKQQIVEVIGTTGFVWEIKDKDVFPIEITKGLNDGSFTEIMGSIKEGASIATGINTLPSATDKKSKSPFMPSIPARKK